MYTSRMQLGVFIIISSAFLVIGHEISTTRKILIPEESFNIKRENCVTNPESSRKLLEVRQLFDQYEIDAYIITDNDFHMNYGIIGHDSRIRAVTGFLKNFGIAVVTRTNAALWTDGRHFREAENETDCGWEIYRKGGPETITVTDWIINQLKDNQDRKTVKSDPSYMNAVWWRNFDKVLSGSGIKLEPLDEDLVDIVWRTGRPLRRSSDINAQDVKYTGRSWQEKVEDVRAEMQKKNVDVLAINVEDEIAWLFNARAKDFPFHPYFYAFAIVELDRVRLYIADHRSKLTRVPSDPETKQKLKDHWNTGEDGSCTSDCVQDRHIAMEEGKFDVKEYNHKTFEEDVAEAASKSKGFVWVPFDCTYKVYSSIPKNNPCSVPQFFLNEKVYQAVPPTSYLKARKNFVEKNGMRNSNLLDSVEIIELFARLENEIETGVEWSVFSAAEEAINVRRRSLSLYRDQSFNTLSGSGAMGANFRYHPSEVSDHVITTHEMFNQDSGGQYLDGTSDLTRTFHYGKPSEHEKEMYTRVLEALINLSKLKFPVGQTGRDIDVVSREPLWEVGADYAHETGHGISHNGAVVEGPARISCIEETHMSDVRLDRSLFGADPIFLESEPDWADYPIAEDMCFTTEPGYYAEGYFGIRLENVMIVRKASLQGSTSSHPFLEFETVTLIPFEPHLIIYDQLNESQVEWLNKYHKEVWEKVAPLLKKKNNTIALDWLYKRVQPVTLHYNIHSDIIKDVKVEL